MKYIWLFICCIFFFLLSCTNEAREAIQSIDTEAITLKVDDPGSFFYDDGMRQIAMNVYEGSLVSLRILDYDSAFEFLISFNENSAISSFVISSGASSIYTMTSLFFNTADHIIARKERFDNLIIIQEVFKDGRVEFSTSLWEDTEVSTNSKSGEDVCNKP